MRARAAGAPWRPCQKGASVGTACRHCTFLPAHSPSCSAVLPGFVASGRPVGVLPVHMFGTKLTGRQAIHHSSRRSSMLP